MYVPIPKSEYFRMSIPILIACVTAQGEGTGGGYGATKFATWLLMAMGEMFLVWGFQARALDLRVFLKI
jgi:hypothetical protein